MILIPCLIFGILCAVLASSKGRHPIGWFFIGFFLGIIGLIIVLVASNLKEVQQQQANMEMEQRRLREQLHQERIKNEQFRKHAQVRLDAHDELLQVNTRHTLAETSPHLLEGSPADAETSVREPDSRKGEATGDIQEGWYYQSGDQSVGPFTLHQMRADFQMGAITRSTNVWHQAITKWTPAAQVDILKKGGLR